jgi:hypothetical protein
LAIVASYSTTLIVKNWLEECDVLLDSGFIMKTAASLCFPAPCAVSETSIFALSPLAKGSRSRDSMHLYDIFERL